MGHWGVKSHENDLAADALDRGFERVHGAVYEDLMDDRNRLTFDQVQRKLANPATLAAAIEALGDDVGSDDSDWDDEAGLAFAGVVTRHAELGVAIPAELARRAIAWLEREVIEWDEQTLRRLRRQREISMLLRAQTEEPTS